MPDASSGFEKNGITLLSGRDPVRRCENIAKTVSLKDRTLYFCPSVLFGYGLPVFLRRLETEAPNSAILCVEADEEIFCLSKKNIDASLLASKKIHLTNICETNRLYALVNEIWGARAFKHIETLRFTGGWQLFRKLYDSLCESLRREIASDWSNALTLTKLGRLYIRNALRNLSLIPDFPSVANLSYGSSPVLVLGAGPSLDMSLDFLFSKAGCQQENRPYKIICVDTCLGALKDRNISADLTVILESQHWNLRDFIGCSGWNIPAAVDLSSLPASAEKLNGGGYLFMTPWTALRIFERLKNNDLLPAVISPLGSVGLTAVELARRLTGGKIICAGLDFSFTQDMYHARSTPGHKDRLNRQNRFHRLHNASACAARSIPAVSKSGIPVFTNSIMKNYRDLFEHEFGGDSRIFDIEGSGLPLGVKTLSMEEAVSFLKIDSKESPHASGAANAASLKTKEKGGCNYSSEINSRLVLFYSEEKKRLEELKDIFTGKTAAEAGRLNTLIEECDYLWAHFPDYTSRSPDLNDISFLNRVRAEIDPMISLLEFYSQRQ